MKTIGKLKIGLNEFVRHNNFRLLVFSYLSGAELYHKISLLNKKTRASLPSAGLLDQVKKLTMALDWPFDETGFKYAFKLVDVIELLATEISIEEVN